MNALSAQNIEDQAVGLGFITPQGFSLACLTCTDSTNNRIKEALGRKEAEWTVVTALEQKSGYGRQGRSWSSPQGGLYVSLLLRPLDHPSFAEHFGRQHVPTLSLVMSIAACRVLTRLGLGAEVQVKWPNDIVCFLQDSVVDGKKESSKQGEGKRSKSSLAKQGKLLGISVEMIGDAVCVGMGINVFRPHALEDSSQKYRTVSVSELLGKDALEPVVFSQGLTDMQKSYMEDTLALLLLEVQCVYNQWLVEGFSPFRDEYRAKSSLHGQAVQLVSLANDILYEGVVCDVDADGCLCLTNEDGAIVRAHSGEVHLK